MKKFLLITLMLAVGSMVYSQSRRVVVSQKLQDVKVPYMKGVNNNGPAQGFNPTVNSHSVLADIIGQTWYDSQSNGSMAQRLWVSPDDRAGAVWTRGMSYTNGYPDRGTGYNYFNGTAWLAAPTGRVESLRTGWPSIARWNGNGEVIVSHQSAGPLVLEKRAVAGTGNWTESFVSNPTDAAPNPLWPSIMTSGDSMQYIHILAITTPVASGGTTYHGLDGALLYWRSSDGGTTWEMNGVQIAGLDSSAYQGFGADSYAWSNARGDTIAFVVGDNWTDTFIMKSTDNGNTWTKIPILSNGNIMSSPDSVVAPFYASDGSNSIALDSAGVFHIVFGRMRASNDGTGRVYYPYTDGLVYWNTTMPMLADSLNLDTLEARGQLVGYVLANAAGDTINTIPYYGVGMTSFGNVTIDSANVYVVWSGVTVDYPSTSGINFRHIYSRGSADMGTSWGPIVDQNSAIEDVYQEFVFPSVAKVTTVDKVHYIAQTADVPGSSVQQPTTVSQHENNIIHNDILKSTLVGVNDLPSVAQAQKLNISNYPNPFRGYTTITLQLPSSSNVVLEVSTLTGKIVSTEKRDNLQAGTYQFQYNAASLAPGVYFYTVRTDNESYTKRMIIR